MSDASGQTTPETYTVRLGSGGEVMVTAPNGRVQFMGLWAVFKLALAVFRRGGRMEVPDDGR